MGSRATNLAELAGSGVLSGAAAQQRTLPLLPAFGELLAQAVVQRGIVVGCEGPAAVSLALALAAGPSQAGAWVGVAGLPEVGLAAMVELGVAPERLVMVAEPAQRFDDAQWADVLAAMIDGFDVLVVGGGACGVRAATARRLLARLQSRGAVLLAVASPGAAGAFGADLRFEATGATWQGLGEGHGVARGRRVDVQLTGRRVPRPRRCELWLPGADGTVEAVPSIDATVVGPLSLVDAALVETASALRRTG
ncbi:MAG: hypothetical protein WCC60_17100 [Ilumatobacteraceae bacterium]